MKTIKEKIFEFFSSDRSSNEAKETENRETDKIQEENQPFDEFSEDQADAKADYEYEIVDDEEETDWENRVLCSDGNCIGVIGPDGRCKVCGKPFEGDPLQMSGKEEFLKSSEDTQIEEIFNDEKKPHSEEIPFQMSGKEESLKSSEDTQIEEIFNDENEPHSEEIPFQMSGKEESLKSSEDTQIEEIFNDENEPPFEEIPLSMDEVEEIEQPENKTDLDLEWQQRQLCSDGNCIGVIGPDGRCKVCGKPWDEKLNN